MAVALRQYTQMTYQLSESASIAWPTGTAVGDLAVLLIDGGAKRQPVSASGWVSITNGTGKVAWCKRVTSTDLASPLAVKGLVTALQTFAGASGLGIARATYGLTITQAGGAVLVFGAAPPPATSIDPTGDRLGVAAQGEWVHQLWWLPRTAAVYTTLSGTDKDVDYYAWEILPLVGPQAPSLASPLAGAQVDAAVAAPFVWLHQSTASADQEQCKVRIRQWTSGGTGTWYYVKADGTWTTTETALTQATQTVSLNAGVLTTGTLYEWQVATYDSGYWSVYSAEQQLTPAAKPTVDSITPTSTAGDLSPAIAWTATAGAGSLSAWQVRVCASADATSDNPLWDSLTQSGTATATVAPSTTAWTNGGTYYAWVRVQQSGGLWSAWTKDNATFAVSWTAPAAPSSVTAANQTSGPLQVTVAGIPTAMGVDLEQSTDGSTWESVVAISAPSATQVIDIPLAAYGVATQYRARTYQVVEDVRLYSSWTTSAAVASTDTAAYLVDDTDRSEWLAVRISDDSSRTTVQGVAVSYGHGATRARVDRSESMGEAGSTRLSVDTDAARTAVVEWLTTKPVWWLRWYPERSGSTLSDAGSTRMALAGPVSTSRLAQVVITKRHISFQWVEQ